MFEKLNKLDFQEKDDGILTDYNEYKMSIGEKVIYSVLAGIAIFAVIYIFYHSLLFSALVCPVGMIYPKYKKIEIIRKQKNELNIQFKDMLYSLSSSISAGRSVESAFKEVLKDLNIQYPDSNSSIIKEVECIIRKINMNETVEEALAEFASRAHLEDVDNFVDVFLTSKRSGGNIVEIIKNSSNIINDKIEIRMEIDTILAERKFEQKVLNLLPIIMIVLLSYTAGDYMQPVFVTLAGKVAMTFCVILLLAAYFISSKIMDINV